MKLYSAQRITICGRVQGVGFRPFLSRLAHGIGVLGWVLNRAGQVELLVQGNPLQLEQFKHDLIFVAPPLAKPEIINCIDVPLADLEGFLILPSEEGDMSLAHIPPDFFMCKDCLQEMSDPSQRRYRYPFINCTQCGPRYTIIRRLPYDRPNTAMAEFSLCPACREEYTNNLDRRYHAQPLACPACGPSLDFHHTGSASSCSNDQALAAAVALLRSGNIVAVKGIGGYHLLCDAGSDFAVTRLRQRKNRPDKPLAIMVPNLSHLAGYVQYNPKELELISDPLRPIVLVNKKETGELSDVLAPGMAELGVMLPYSPLHHLLLSEFGKPLVATSANISGEPVLTAAGEVEDRLGQVADGFLHHNRPILRPADDAVYRCIAGTMRPLRLGRGCAPMELDLPYTISKPLLAVGGQMKNSIALAWDNRVVISPHIGDLGSRRSQEVFEQVIGDLSALYGVKVAEVVCDAHPDYRSSRWATQSGLPLQRVFHHHAHASALAGEHAIEDSMLVFTWDGTGFGEDGTLWGGEGLLGAPGIWRRVCSFKPFRLPGGDLASREPWRSALALVWESGLEWDAGPKDSNLIRQAWQKNINTPVSSSVGRIFDAASALLGIVPMASYEGQAAMALETVSAPSAPALNLPLQQHENGLWLSDWSPMLPLLLDNSKSTAERGGIFHVSLAQALLDQSIAIRTHYQVNRVGLTGGVFQNRILTEQAVNLLKQSNFQVYLPEKLPANDGALSFGQIIEATAHFSGNNATPSKIKNHSSSRL